MYAYCIAPVMPIRNLPDHRAEMVSQLLFGEQVILKSAPKDGWISISCTSDGYEGWVTINQLFQSEINVEDNFQVAADWSTRISCNNKEMLVPFGSSFRLINRFPSLIIQVLGNSETMSDERSSINSLEHAIALFKGTAYLWGGKSVYGTDCSGFVQSVFKYLKIQLPRNASEQALTGETVYFLQEAKLGDLAFFEGAEGEIIHVGILLNSSQIVHSWGNVRIDAIDTEGIVNQTDLSRTHKLRLIKRITSF